jgi:hypothetical protein
MRIYRLDNQCKVVNSTAYPSSALDPEDLAVGPDGAIWSADIGDNDGKRTTVALWKIPPNERTPVIHRVTYPDGAKDAEALLINGDGTPIIVTKESGKPGIYVPSAPLQPRSNTGVPLKRVGEFALPASSTPTPLGPPGRLVVTGGATSADGKKVALRTYADALEWDVPDGDVVKAITTGKPRVTPLPNEPQGESITYSRDGKSFLTASELPAGSKQNPLLRYTPAAAAAPATAATKKAGGNTEDDGGGVLSIDSINEIMYMVGAVGVLGLILVVVGVFAIRRSRTNRRAAAAAARMGRGGPSGPGGPAGPGPSGPGGPGGRGNAGTARVAARSAPFDDFAEFEEPLTQGGGRGGPGVAAGRGAMGGGGRAVGGGRGPGGPGGPGGVGPVGGGPVGGPGGVGPVGGPGGQGGRGGGPGGPGGRGGGPGGRGGGPGGPGGRGGPGGPGVAGGPGVPGGPGGNRGGERTGSVYRTGDIHGGTGDIHGGSGRGVPSTGDGRGVYGGRRAPAPPDMDWDDDPRDHPGYSR